MREEKGKIISKPFQALFDDADYHLAQSEKHHLLLQEHEKSSTKLPDQSVLKKCNASARACIIASVAGIEAFANSVWNDFKTREPSSLKQNWVKKLKKKTFEFWQLKDKLRFLPTLCNQLVVDPKSVFSKDERIYTRFCELIKIRNLLAHGKLTSVGITVIVQQNHIHKFDDSASENHWPITGIPKDIYSISYPHAKIAYETSIDVLKHLIEVLECPLNERFLLDQEARLSGKSFSVRRHEGGPIPTNPQWYKLITE